MSFRVLIADDEALNRQDLKELLVELGYSVTAEARDGRQALALVEAHKPDVVILDIMMPYINGIEVAKQISHEYPVIMLTAHSSPDFIHDARDAGVMAYLTKPYREKDIGPAIELAVTHFMREAHLSERVNTLAQQLEARKIIERGKSLLMQHQQLSEMDAYRQMQKLSMEKNISMKQVAEMVIALLNK
ncbi:MAG: response regulator [Gammaproteobacteria bacterium]|nr:response regulator [Gammaproteobacteria bacterium]